jgi:RNA polymerase sigma-70 factor (sigma-E family)
MAGGGQVGDVDVPAAASSIEELFRTQRLPLVRLAILLIGDRGSAEDVVQDAFLSVSSRLATLRSPDAAAAYLRVATVNNCRSHLRRRALSLRHPPRVDVDRAGDSVLDAVVLAEEHREVLALLPTLSRRQREVIVLRYWSGLSEAQIAQALGVSVGTVKTTASRALAQLSRKVRKP